jgi:hypothetical protein
MISAVHRLPSSTAASASGGSGSPPRPPPIVIRFVRKQTRSVIMTNRKLLRGKTISITDHLSPSRSNLLKKATALVASQKLQSAWSHDGKILVKNLQNRTVQIFNDPDLAQFN